MGTVVEIAYKLWIPVKWKEVTVSANRFSGTFNVFVVYVIPIRHTRIQD